MIALADDCATQHMRAFADACAREWGRQVWRLWMQDQGWPARTLLGRIIDEGLTGAGHTGGKQWYPEAFDDKGQLVSRALRRMPESDRNAIAIHYAVPVPVKRKLVVLKIPESTYFRSLRAARDRLANLLGGA